MKQKIKIMRTPTHITDEEIHSFMDFDALLKLREKAVRQQRSFRKTKSLIAGLAILLVVPAAYFMLSGEKKGSPTERTVTPRAAEVTPDNNNDVQIDTLKNDLKKKDPITSLTVPEKQEMTETNRIAEGLKESKRETDLKPEKVVPVYVQAEPVQGYPLLYEYFEKNLVYPKDVVKDSTGGTLNVAFIIDPTGDATDISVENSPGPLFEKEAIRLIENMPLWRPATYNGIPVKSKISLPITFSIHKIGND